jgi:hypothetical protein
MKDVSKEQVELAIRAVLQYDKKQDNKELLSGDGFIWVQCAFKKTPALHKSAKQLTLAHSLFDDKTGADVLLFAKDPVQTTETLLEKHDIKGNVSVMGISKLKNEYKEYEKKRKLALSYDLFLADDRFVARLAPTQQSPVACRSLVGALAATYIHHREGRRQVLYRCGKRNADRLSCFALLFPLSPIGSCRCCQSCWASTSCPLKSGRPRSSFLGRKMWYGRTSRVSWQRRSTPPR